MIIHGSLSDAKIIIVTKILQLFETVLNCLFEKVINQKLLVNIYKKF